MKNKNIRQLEEQLKGCLVKLSNPKFVALAPTSVLEKEIQKKKDILANIEAENLMVDKTYEKVFSHSYVKDNVTYYVYNFKEIKS